MKQYSAMGWFDIKFSPDGAFFHEGYIRIRERYRWHVASTFQAELDGWVELV